MLETVVRPRLPVHLAQTLAPFKHGPLDPTVRRDPDGATWRATRTPDGPAAVRFFARADGAIEVGAWGEGAERAIAAAPDLLGARDTLDGFAPRGRLLAIHRRFPGLRFGRSGAIFQALAPVVLEQLVASEEAHESWRMLVFRTSEPAPAPRKLWLPPTPEAIARFRPFDLRAIGVGGRRAGTLQAVARRGARLERIAEMRPEEARAALEAMPGIGPWTAGRVTSATHGDPDAVPIGDFHIPHMVTFAFTGEARGDDARMLELLAPYAGHRARVIRLLQLAGISAPRFGPRRPLRAAWR